MSACRDLLPGWPPVPLWAYLLGIACAYVLGFYSGGHWVKP
jgi:hypothetical protein